MTLSFRSKGALVQRDWVRVALASIVLGSFAAGCAHIPSSPRASSVPRSPAAVVSLVSGTHTRKLSGFRVLDLSFVDRRDGYALGGFFGTDAQPIEPPVMALMRTKNGGRRWTTVGAPPRPVEHLAFTSLRLGWAFGPKLFVTRDGGASWLEERRSGRQPKRVVSDRSTTTRADAAAVAGTRAPRRWADVEFIDARHGWAASGKHVYRTVDGGRHWTAVRLRPAACGCIHRVDIH